ncbi:heparinase II/III domain-containing protein [Pseudocolwellia sp. HL-MZ19]|uniref:heparinase II/III domain-containing protein n=1 Tax=Pseudocolwellia sp. HL-MZ19 TaxID=3400846 RepID=UPI003CE8B339
MLYQLIKSKSLIFLLISIVPMGCKANEISELPWLNKNYNVTKHLSQSSEISIWNDFNVAEISDLYFKNNDKLGFEERLMTDKAFSEGWKKLKYRVKILIKKDKDNSLEKNKSEKYIYTLANHLLDLSFYYRITRDLEAGKLLRKLAINTAKKKLAFWMHEPLRKFNIKWPRGQLETALLTHSLSLSISWGSDLFSKKELNLISNNLKHKGLYPILRFLDTTSLKNNYISVLSASAISASLVLNDNLAITHSKKHLENWTKLIETDGSYGEQIEYFNYACNHFAMGSLLSSNNDLKNINNEIPQLKNTLLWQMSHFSLDSQNTPLRINFGDDDYLGGPPNEVCLEFVTKITKNGLGSWFINRLNSTNKWDKAQTLIAKLALSEFDYPKPINPNLDMKISKFENGTSIIRSNWTMNHDTVFALRSGSGNLTKYSHDMPNRNSIALQVNGDYLLVTPGRASYRSRLRKNYDLKTENHNTVTFDNKDQFKKPEATLSKANKITKDIYFISSDATNSYKNSPNSVIRNVYYLEKLNTFIILDIVKLKQPDIIQTNWHFGNYETRNTLKKVTKQQWHLKAPNSYLKFWLFNNKETSTTVEDGIMHTGYSYFPKAKQEGEWGNVFKMQQSTNKKENDVLSIAILSPSLGEENSIESVETFQITPLTKKIIIRKNNKETIIEINNEVGFKSIKIDNLKLDKFGSIISSTL